MLNRTIRKLRIFEACVYLIPLLAGTIWFTVRIARAPEQFPMDPHDFRAQAEELPKGLTEAEVDVWLKGYNTKWANKRGVRYGMKANPDAITWMPALGYSVTVTFDNEGKSVSAESAD